VGEKLIIDIKQWAGKASYPSTFQNGKYTVTIIDSESDFAIGKVISTRRQLLTFLSSTYRQIRLEGKTPTIFQVDNEYSRLDGLQQFCQQQTPKIDLRSGTPYDHFQQGKVERLHRTMQDSVQKYFARHPHLPQTLWGYAYLHFLDLHNHLPSARNPTSTPALRWGGTAIDLHKTPLFPFGTLVVAHIPLDLQTANSGRGFPAYFLGRAPGYDDAVLLYNTVSNRPVVRRTYKVIAPKPLEPLLTTIFAPGLLLTADMLSVDDTISMEDSAHVPKPASPSDDIGLSAADDTTVQLPDSPCHYTNVNISDVHHSQRKYFSYLKRTFFDNDEEVRYTITGVYRFSSGSDNTLFYQLQPTDAQSPIADSDLEYQSCRDLLSAPYVYWEEVAPALALSTTVIPHSFSQAVAHPTDSAQFLTATETEVRRWNQLGVVGTLDVDPTSLLPSQIGQLRTLYSIKRRADGTYDKHKLRIYFDGSRWKHLYGDSTYAGVARRETQRLLLTLAAIHDYDLWGFDISTFSLYAKIPDDVKIYARRPPGFPDHLLPPLMRLTSYVYGHPEANSAAVALLRSFLEHLGFKATKSDPHLYMLHNLEHPDFCLISTHVDDGTCISKPGSNIRAWIQDRLRERFDITSEDDLSTLLGMTITRDRSNHTIDLHMTKSFDDLFSRFPEAVCCAANDESPPTPMVATRDIGKQLLELSQYPLDAKGITEYQEIIGICNWISTCRYDIVYATNTLARSMKSPTKLDRYRARHLLRYLYGTRNLTLRLGGPDATLVTFSTVDSSYASHIDLKSHTGATFHVSTQGAPYDVLTHKQSVTADSSTVSETIGVHYSTKNIIWLRSLLNELGYTLDPTTLYCDNKSTLRIISNSGSSGRSKHIELRYLVVREYISSGSITMDYLPTDDMLADMFTKPLGPTQFIKLRDIVMGHQPLPATLSILAHLQSSDDT